MFEPLFYVSLLMLVCSLTLNAVWYMSLKECTSHLQAAEMLIDMNNNAQREIPPHG